MNTRRGRRTLAVEVLPQRWLLAADLHLGEFANASESGVEVHPDISAVAADVRAPRVETNGLPVPNPTDVDGDGQLTARDATLVLDELTTCGSHSIVPGPDGGTGNLDVNGDGWVSPLDALLVINDLNRERASDTAPLGHLEPAHAAMEAMAAPQASSLEPEIAELPSTSGSLRFGPAPDVLNSSTAQRPTAVPPVSEDPFAVDLGLENPGSASRAFSHASLPSEVAKANDDRLAAESRWAQSVDEIMGQLDVYGDIA